MNNRRVISDARDDVHQPRRAAELAHSPALMLNVLKLWNRCAPRVWPSAGSITKIALGAPSPGRANRQ
jgi:hypothetical protein